MDLSGISSDEARARLAIHGINELPSEVERPLWQVVIAVLREPMLLLLMAAGIISFFLADLVDALLLMVTVFIVIGISIYQERRTERALHALHQLTAPLAIVIRDGIEIRIPSSQLVPGDLLVVSEGDRVSADAVLLSPSAIELDESLLTGESIPVPKSIGETLFTGSLVVRGHGRAEITSTGTNTELGKIGKSIQQIPFQRTLLQQNIDRLVRVVGALALVAVLLIFYLYGSTRGNWLEGALAGIAAAMALIPEEFPVIITLFMALGAWRMAKVRVIARQPAVIEALGAVTVLCVDKTGTITLNEMRVSEVQDFERSQNIEDGNLAGSLQEIIKIASLAVPVRPFDPMDKAFTSLAERMDLRPTLESVQEFPVTRERLAFTHIWKSETSSLIAAKGAPEQIAQMCKLIEPELSSLERMVDLAAKRGFRVIAVAKVELTDRSSQVIDLEKLNFIFLGLALLHDPVREGVPEAVRTCAAAGIRTVMITGDHPTTALAIAKEIGIDGTSRCLTGSELNGMSDQELRSKIKERTVFARVNPEHKLRIVEAMRDNGEVVAMTGDGVNDAPALRAAHVGIAMGARGTDVAREAAALVITDDNYTSIVAGINRGRAIFANIQKAMSYVIAIHIPIFGIALLPIFNQAWPLILLPALIAFHEVIIDPACSVVFEVEEPDPYIMQRPPREPNQLMFGRNEVVYAATQGLGVLIGVMGVFLFAINSGYSEELSRSLTFGTLLISNIFLILANRSRTLTIIGALINRRNSAVPWIIASASLLLLLLLNVPALGSAFELAEVDWHWYLIMPAIAYLSVAWIDIYKIVQRIRTSH